MLATYLPFWYQIHQNVNQLNHQKTRFLASAKSVPMVSTTPKILNKKDVADNFLVHHMGMNKKLVQYFMNRGLISSGYTEKFHQPVILFNVRKFLLKNHQHKITPADLKYSNTLEHDMWISYGHPSGIGKQEEALTGINYLFLKPSHFTYMSNHKKHHLLTIDKNIGHHGYYQYQSNLKNVQGFNFRIGTERNKLYVASTPLELLSYAQLHLKKHRQMNGAIFLSTFNQSRNIDNYIQNQAPLTNGISHITLLPNHELSSQKQVQCVGALSNQKNVTVQYPVKPCRSWHQMLQEHSFNNHYYVETNQNFSFKHNERLQIFRLMKSIGRMDSQQFNVMAVASYKEYQALYHHQIHQIHSSDNPVNCIAINKNYLLKPNQHKVNHFMQNVGFNMSPKTLAKQANVAYRHVYNADNPLLASPLIKKHFLKINPSYAIKKKKLTKKHVHNQAKNILTDVKSNHLKTNKKRHYQHEPVQTGLNPQFNLKRIHVKRKKKKRKQRKNNFSIIQRGLSR